MTICIQTFLEYKFIFITKHVPFVLLLPIAHETVIIQSKIFLGTFRDKGGHACDATADFCRTAPLIVVGSWQA